MHDGRVDRAAMVAVSNPAEIIPAAGETIAARMKTFTEADAHTHPDHNTAKNLMNSFTYQSPSVPPRKDQHHKIVLSEIEMGGRHAFDNTNLPLLAD